MMRDSVLLQVKRMAGIVGEGSTRDCILNGPYLWALDSWFKWQPGPSVGRFEVAGEEAESSGATAEIRLSGYQDNVRSNSMVLNMLQATEGY